MFAHLSPIKKQKVYKKPSIPIKDKDVRKEDLVVVENSVPEVHISPTEESLDDSLLSSVIDESVAETFEQQNNPANYEEQVQKMYNQTPMIAGRFKE